MSYSPEPKQSGYMNLINQLIKHPRYPYSDNTLIGLTNTETGTVGCFNFDVGYQQNVNLVMSIITPLAQHEVEVYDPNNPSQFFPRPPGKRSCLLYLHTHKGTRSEGTYLVDFLSTYDTSLVLFDFAGAGDSGGEYTSFGWFETEQVRIVIEYLTNRLGFDSIGLWGKSMGASAAVMYLGKYFNPLVRFVIIDSCFDKLKHAIINIASSNSSAPEFALKTFMLFVANTVKSKAGFDIYKVNPIEYVDKIKIPTVFVIGDNDQVVKKKEFFNLHGKCGSTFKKLYVVKGEHADNRLEDDNFRHTMEEFMSHFFPLAPLNHASQGSTPRHQPRTSTQNPAHAYQQQYNTGYQTHQDILGTQHHTYQTQQQQPTTGLGAGNRFGSTGANTLRNTMPAQPSSSNNVLNIGFGQYKNNYNTTPKTVQPLFLGTSSALFDSNLSLDASQFAGFDLRRSSNEHTMHMQHQLATSQIAVANLNSSILTPSNEKYKNFYTNLNEDSRKRYLSYDGVSSLPQSPHLMNQQASIAVNYDDDPLRRSLNSVTSYGSNYGQHSFLNLPSRDSRQMAQQYSTASYGIPTETSNFQGKSSNNARYFVSSAAALPDPYSSQGYGQQQLEQSQIDFNRYNSINRSSAVQPATSSTNGPSRVLPSSLMKPLEPLKLSYIGLKGTSEAAMTPIMSSQLPQRSIHYRSESLTESGLSKVNNNGYDYFNEDIIQ